MEIPKHLYATIQLAAVRAKLIFDTYGWTWMLEKKPPTAKEIMETLISMVEDVLRQANEIVDGKPVGSGNAMTGRLHVEFVDDQWIFSVQIADTFGASNDDESRYEDPKVAELNLANLAEMGI